MDIKIGKVVKQLRIEQSVTQEKLADYLNVSSQSVSKWENGLSYPDITFVPKIALFFNVSIDELFAWSTYANNHKFLAYKSKYEACRNNGDIKNQISICRQMFLDYPQNYSVMSDLASSLITCYEGLEENHQLAIENNYLDEAIKISECILSHCNEMDLQLNATRILCKYYPLVNQTDKALALANKLPSIYFCKDILLEDILTGDQCIKQQQLNILQCTDLIAQTLIHLSFTKDKCIPNLSLEEKMEFVAASNALYEIIIPDKNYLYFHSRLACNYRRLAELHLAKNHIEESMI